MGAMHGLFRAVNTALGVTARTITATLDLLATCAHWQFVSASAAQNVRLPSTTGMLAGWAVTVENTGTAVITLQTSGGAATLYAIAPGDGALARWDGSAWLVRSLESGLGLIKLASSGTSFEIDLAYGGNDFTPSGNYTLTATHIPSAGIKATLFRIGSGGAYTPTWPSGINWDGGAPTLSASGSSWVQLWTWNGALWGRG